MYSVFGHPFPDLEKRFPNHSRRVYGRLSKVLLALANWCPLMGQIEFLPQMVFPFVKIFGDLGYYDFPPTLQNPSALFPSAIG